MTNGRNIASNFLERSTNAGYWPSHLDVQESHGRG